MKRILYYAVMVAAVHAPYHALLAQEQTETFLPNEDAFIDEMNPSANYGYESSLMIGNNERGWAVSLLRFGSDFQPPLPSDAIITSATFKWYCALDYTDGTARLFALDEPWSENSVTWDNFWPPDVWYGNGLPLFSIAPGWVSADITKYVREWHAGFESNYGFVVKLEASSNQRAGFYSREGSFGPRLDVEYHLCVTGVDASDGSFGDKVRVKWDPIPGEGMQYRVFRCTSAHSNCSLDTTSCTPDRGYESAAEWDDYPASEWDAPFPCDTYYYRVQATNGRVVGRLSPSDGGFRDPGGCDDDPPNAPSNVDAQSGSGCGDANLSWDSSTDATGYRIYYDEDSNNPSFNPTEDGSPSSGSDVGNVTSVTITGLTPDDSYYFAVKAYNAEGDSDYSSQDTARAGDDCDTPAIVTNTGTVTVPEGDIATFQVKLSTQPANTVTVSVSRVSGDTDITVQSGSSLSFTTSNWSSYKTVTLAAAEDSDTSNGMATFRCSASGLPNMDLDVTEADNDDDTNATYHPADQAQDWDGDCTCATCGDGKIEMCESIGYAAAWKRDDHNDMAAAMRGLYLWKQREHYHWDENQHNWMPGALEILTLDLGGGVTMELVGIPAGTFMMGSENGDSDETPVHSVTITQDFYIGRYEVTQEQWRAVMGDNPSQFGGCDRCPVESVSWSDAVDFCDTLSGITGYDIRLPTEAEWEYACRAGTTTEYSFGNSEGDLDDYAWYSATREGTQTYEAGGKLPNAWGLYDMHGNEWEWCTDWYGSGYYDSTPYNNPPGPADGTQRVIRGGSRPNPANVLRSANRTKRSIGHRDWTIGFRAAMD